MFKIWCHDERPGILTNKIAGDGLVLFSMIAQVGYGSKHVKLDLVRHGEPGFLERHCRVLFGDKKGRGATRKF